MATSFNPRTLKACEKLGWMADIVERRLSHLSHDGTGAAQRPWGKSKDMFGFIDILAVNLQGGTGFIGLQVTSKGNLATRIKKVVEDEVLIERAYGLLRASNAIQFWGFHKVTLPGTKLVRWDARRRAMVLRGDVVEIVEIPTLLEAYELQAVRDNELKEMEKCPNQTDLPMFG